MHVQLARAYLTIIIILIYHSEKLATKKIMNE